MMTQPPTAQQEAMRAAVQTYRPLADLVPAHWQEGAVRVNGMRLHYYRTGETKPALLLLHGFNENGLTWLRVARALEADFDVVMPDARGHGHSEGVAAGGFSSDLLLADVAALIPALGLGRPRVIGFSQGGMTALRLAAAHPDLVHSFIYEGYAEMPPRGDIASAPSYQAWFQGWLAQLAALKPLPHRELMVAVLPQVLPLMRGGLWPEEEYVPMATAYAQFDLDLARDSMKLWAADDPAFADLVAAVRCPGLVMQHPASFGPAPAPGGVPDVHYLPSPNPLVRIVDFENTGHAVRRIAFDLAMGLVREFLQTSAQ
jgi:pimeloyl-ACP methyl ester carboxylesterase